MGYIAFKLDDKSRETLLESFPPKFPDVVCHHVTMVFGVPQPDESMLNAFNTSNIPVHVVGYVCDNVCEALVVSMGEAKTTRLDGKTFHITHSLDKSAGVTPKYSNTILDKIGWSRRTRPILISGTFEYFN